MRFLITCLLCICFAACKKKCEPESFSYGFFKGNTIDTVSYSTGNGTERTLTTQIKNGNMLVFRYAQYFASCSDQSDQTYQTVHFEIPANLDDFALTDSASLHNAKAIYSLWATGAEEARFFSQGSIKGKKLSDNSWQINAALSLPGRADLISIDKRFRLN